VPSVIIAKTTITVAQALFLVVGLVVAWTVLPSGSQILPGMLWLLLVEVLAIAGFLAAQISGLVRRGGRLLKAVGVLDDAAAAETLDRALRGYYRHQWGRLTLSIAFHLLGWLLGVLESVLVLWALDVDPSLAVATLVEALGSGVRFATFLVPASLGPLEAANTAAFAALGLGAGAGLAYSLVRRARQAVWIVIGIAVLLIMRWSAGRAAPAPRPA
jgi:hypothetical protein